MDLEHKVAREFRWYPDRTKMRGRELDRKMAWAKQHAKNFLDDLKNYNSEEYEYPPHAHLGETLIFKSYAQFKKDCCSSDFSISQLGWKQMREIILVICQSIRDCVFNDVAYYIEGQIPIRGTDMSPSLNMIKVENMNNKRNQWVEMEEWLNSQGFPYKCHKNIINNDCYCNIRK